jgi:hypothetical protein
MSISINNELENEGDPFSPFMRPVLDFQVGGAAAVTNPTAEIEFVGTSETITFEAIFVRTVGGIHYFAVDLSDVMKHLLSFFDGSSYPDDLEFINGNLVQRFDEYFRALEFDVYFERGTADEQTDTFSHYWLYLADQMPANGGFLLSRVYNHTALQNLKWSKNTYNAIFFWAGGETIITKGTVGETGSYTADSTTVTADDSVTVDGSLTGTGGTVIYSGTLTSGYYQLKFAKTSIYLDRGKNTITIDTPSGTQSIVIDYDPDCPDYYALCWQHPLLGYVSFPFNGNKVTNITAKKRNEFDKFRLTMVDANSLKEITGFDETRRVTLTTKADSQYWPLLEALYSSRHVYLFVGYDGATDSSLNWTECEVSGGGSFRSDRSRATFSVELTLPEPFNVKF